MRVIAFSVPSNKQIGRLFICARLQAIFASRSLDAVDANRFVVTDDHVRNARRAYCANISYLDENIGVLLDTVSDCGFADDTVVVFVSDHGDMLGERGLWYKMNFFEGAARIPLSIAAPGRFAPRNVSMPASAMDVLPTLLELADVHDDKLAVALDGQSLVAAAMGEAQKDRLIACEYMAEGSVSTVVMLRQGPWKYIYCEADPVQLYNLDNDPQEMVNLANAPEYVDTLEHFTTLRTSRWNLDVLDDDVRENQQRRIVCYEALREGRFTAWDHQPVQDASERFMRNHLDLNEVEAGNRVAVKPATPPMNHGSN